MSSATGPSPPPPAGPPERGPSPAARRRWRIAIVVGVLGVCAVSILGALALRPSEPTGYGPELVASVEAACRRAAPDVADPSEACRCAYQRLAESVPFERLVDLDDELLSQGRPAPELEEAVGSCLADHG
jgi:hypothetical protein